MLLTKRVVVRLAAIAIAAVSYTMTASAAEEYPEGECPDFILQGGMMWQRSGFAFKDKVCFQVTGVVTCKSYFVANYVSQTGTTRVYNCSLEEWQ